MRLRIRLAAASVALALSACGLWTRPPLDPTVDPDVTVLRVDNESTADITVYAMDGAAAHRIGRVRAQTTHEFNLPTTFLAASSSLQLFVRPVGSYAYRLPAVQVGGGQRLALTVTNDPAFASVAVIPPAVPR